MINISFHTQALNTRAISSEGVGIRTAVSGDAHACGKIYPMSDGRSLCRYLCFLAVETLACAWSAHGMLPCLNNPHPLLPWHTVFGLDWRVAAALLALGLLLPYLACLLAFQLYLAATAQTARECLRRYVGAHPHDTLLTHDICPGRPVLHWRRQWRRRPKRACQFEQHMSGLK